MYEVVPGSIEVTVGSIEAQTRDIERQLKADFGDALAPELIQQFTRTVEDIAGSLEYEDLEEVCVDGRDPLVSYLRLDEKHHAEILDRLGDDVSPDAIQLLEKFIFENCEGDDVMNLVVRKAFAIKNDHAAGLPSASA
jgi:hypothetical protein